MTMVIPVPSDGNCMRSNRLRTQSSTVVFPSVELWTVDEITHPSSPIVNLIVTFPARSDCFCSSRS